MKIIITENQLIEIRKNILESQEITDDQFIKILEEQFDNYTDFMYLGQSGWHEKNSLEKSGDKLAYATFLAEKIFYVLYKEKYYSVKDLNDFNFYRHNFEIKPTSIEELKKWFMDKLGPDVLGIKNNTYNSSNTDTLSTFNNGSEFNGFGGGSFGGGGSDGSW